MRRLGSLGCRDDIKMEGCRAKFGSSVYSRALYLWIVESPQGAFHDIF